MERGISVENNGVDYIKTPDGLKATPPFDYCPNCGNPWREP